MEISNKLLGIIGTVLVLLGFGGSRVLTSDEFENSYVCDVTEEIGIFYGGISGTSYTAYPYKENRTDYERCSTIGGVRGKWISLRKYAATKGIDPMSFLVDYQEKKIYIEVVNQVVGCGDTWCTTSPDGKQCYPKGLLSAGRPCLN